MDKTDVALKDKTAAAIQVSYADFIRLFRVTNPDDWALGLRVAIDGVWVNSPKANPLRSPEEHATLSEHPDGDLTKPVVSFPCSLGLIESRIYEFYGCGYIKPFALANFVAEKLRKPQPVSQIDVPIDTRVHTNLLRMIRALDVMATLPAHGATGSVENQLQELGFTGPREATIRKILTEARALEAD